MDLGKGGTESAWVVMEDRVMGATVCVEAEVDWVGGSARGTGEVCTEMEDPPWPAALRHCESLPVGTICAIVQLRCKLCTSCCMRFDASILPSTHIST